LPFSITLLGFIDFPDEISAPIHNFGIWIPMYPAIDSVAAVSGNPVPRLKEPTLTRKTKKPAL
jgi:hypothetical protein